MTTAVVSLIAALGVGGWIGGLINSWLSERREKAARAAAFRKQQLEEFYGPLLALHKEVRGRSELRVKLSRAIDARVQDGLDHEAHSATIVKNIEDESSTFREILMPCYRKMVTTFRDKMWLAEAATRDHFPALIEYVDVWEKILADRLPKEIAAKIGHTEANLKSFYDHLEEVHNRLQAELLGR